MDREVCVHGTLMGTYCEECEIEVAAHIGEETIMADFDSKGLTEQQRKSKQSLQDFIKDHPILKQQEKFKRMERALDEIYEKTYFPTNDEYLKEIAAIAREALKED